MVIHKILYKKPYSPSVVDLSLHQSQTKAPPQSHRPLPSIARRLASTRIKRQTRWWDRIFAGDRASEGLEVSLPGTNAVTADTASVGDDANLIKFDRGVGEVVECDVPFTGGQSGGAC
jgi:hypothetical protein